MVTVIKKGSSKTSIKQQVQKLQSNKRFDAKKHCGVIKLKVNPQLIQKQLRDEWE